MAPISLNEFQKQRIDLKGKPLKDHRSLLSGIGQYYRNTIPSEIDLTYAIETEQYLNNLYLEVDDELSSSELVKLVEETLGLASAISFGIKSRNFDNELFVRTKRLGKALINLSRSLPNR